MRRRSRGTDISLWDHVRLKQEFLSRPAFVLRHFGPCQVEALDQMDLYLEIEREDKAGALKIAKVAAEMGIPISLATPSDAGHGGV